MLAALGPGPLHGYGIIKAVEEMSEGRVRLRAGTLYGALERLESQGYVAFDGEGSEGGPARRYYRLTTAGAATAGRRGLAVGGERADRLRTPTGRAVMKRPRARRPAADRPLPSDDHPPA